MSAVPSTTPRAAVRIAGDRPLTRRREIALGAAGIACLVLGYWYASGAREILPPLAHVLDALPAFIADSQTLADIGMTTQRVVVALVAGMALGFATALLMERTRLVGQVASRYVTVAFGVPSTLAALLALYVFKRSELGVYVVVALIVFPFAAATFSEGLRARDRRLDQVSQLYGLSRVARLRHLDLPQLAPFALASARNEYAHAWRVVILAELFATSDGMGAAFARAFDRFELVTVMLWLIVFVVLLLGSEYVVLRPAERRLLRWRAAR